MKAEFIAKRGADLIYVTHCERHGKLELKCSIDLEPILQNLRLPCWFCFAMNVENYF